MRDRMNTRHFEDNMVDWARHPRRNPTHLPLAENFQRLIGNHFLRMTVPLGSRLDDLVGFFTHLNSTKSGPSRESTNLN